MTQIGSLASVLRWQRADQSRLLSGTNSARTAAAGEVNPQATAFASRVAGPRMTVAREKHTQWEQPEEAIHILIKRWQRAGSHRRLLLMQRSPPNSMPDV